MRPLQTCRRNIEQRQTELKSVPGADHVALRRTGENPFLLPIFCPTSTGCIFGTSLFRQGSSPAGPTQSSDTTDKCWGPSACTFAKFAIPARRKYSSLLMRVTSSESLSSEIDRVPH